VALQLAGDFLGKLPPPEIAPMLPETTSGLAVLAWEARGKALAAKTHAEQARAWMTANGAPTRAKAAIGAVGTGDATLGSEAVSIGDWSNSARTTSAFYRMWADGAFIRAPANMRVAMVTSSPSAGVVAEGKSIPVSKTVLNNVVLTPEKVAALMVVTDELLLRVDAVGQQMFNRELMGVLSAAVDAAFVAKIGTGVTPITSSAPMADLRAALTAITGSTVPRPYWLSAVDVAKWGSTLTQAKGGPPFAAASVVGGELANIPLLVSSGIPSGMLYLIDAAAICADAVAPTVEVSVEADVQMDTAPGMASDVPTAANLVSMFQTNSTALKATALSAAEKLRSNAVAVISGISATTWAP
jgi:Phage capsid family